MTALKILSLIGKIAGLVTALETIPFLDPQTGVLILAAASLLKDTANRIGDLVDDGRVTSPNFQEQFAKRCRLWSEKMLARARRCDGVD